jgi:hypothetical protein
MKMKHKDLKEWRWRFDTASLLAVHASGLTVRFTAAADDPAALDGFVEGGVPAGLDILEVLRLMCQAAQGLAYALARETKH